MKLITTMQQKYKYNKPTIKKIVCLEKTSIMSGSIVDETTVTSTGQEVVEFDFSDETFNQNWE